MTCVPTPVVFSWDKLDHATTYHLQVSTGFDFGDPTVSANDIDDTYFSFPGLASSTIYYWRIKASNVAGTGPFSSIWSFTTNAILPEAPLLAAPANNANGVIRNTELRWYAVTAAQRYIIQVATLPDFSSIVFEKSDVTGTWYELPSLEANTLYFWRIAAVSDAGTGPYSSIWMFTTGATFIDESDAVPTQYALYPAYPNPFNLCTTIAWQLPETAFVTIKIYNSIGQLIRELETGIFQAGKYHTNWNGYDNQGLVVTSGLYLYRFESGEHHDVKKMMLLR
ncbi:MAG TPA: FlgD immunoglobulin-like domain containing protein [bacterium]|nr:FlgD immunoglobulin-like domain containing protein [bacterium]